MSMGLDTQGGKDFVTAPDLKGGPVPNEQVLENIKKSSLLEAPVFERRKNQRGSFVFVGGGPTMLDFLDVIKEHKAAGDFICTSNKTYDFLIEQGIVPDGCLVIDPKECVKDYIKNPQKETEFFIGVVCNENVIKNLLDGGYNTQKILVGYGLEDQSDVIAQKGLYPQNNDFLVGGTMTGLRAMNFASMMGYGIIDYYGFDSCFATGKHDIIYSNDPGFERVKKVNKGMMFLDHASGRHYTIRNVDDGFFYAYKKRRGEDIQIAEVPDGRRFLTSPCFAHQAKQAIKWIERCEGKVEVRLHGDNLTSALWECRQKAREEAVKRIGTKRWTQGYEELQKDLHKKGKYGAEGHHDLELVGRSVLALYHKYRRKLTFLDYGCGQEKLSKALNQIFNVLDTTLYDPFIDKHSKEPEGEFDLVTCFDVMEHVEEPCINNVLKHIVEKSKAVILFSIALGDAVKTLKDGRNAHITQKNAMWWYKKIAQYFAIVETAGNEDIVYFACQSMKGVS
jgi:hypothetical protein